MNRRLLVLIPLLAVAVSITSLAFDQPSAGRSQSSKGCAVDSATPRSSSLITAGISGSTSRPNP